MSSNSSPESDDSVFQTLWSEAIAAKRHNQEFKAVLETLVERLKDDVVPVEVELGSYLHKVLDKQLAFSKRRTLSKRHRVELHRWMDETVRCIKQMGDADEDILERAAIAHVTFNNIPTDPDSDVSIAQQVDHFYAEKDNPSDPDNGESNLFDESLSLSNSSSPATDESSILGEGVPGAFDGDVERVRNLGEFDDSVFKKLFRRTANALHPDKEQDITLRELKQKLMGDLLESRKNYDVVVLLNLHNEYVADSPELTSKEKNSLATVLHYFIGLQKESTDTPIYKSGLHYWGYRRFYSPRKVIRTEKVNHYLELLIEQCEACAQFTDEINTVFKLGAVLDQRIVKKHTISSPGRDTDTTTTDSVLKTTNLERVEDL